MVNEEFEIPRNAAARSATDLLSPELVQSGEDASTAIRVFSSVKSTADVTLTIPKVLDVLPPFAQGD